MKIKLKNVLFSNISLKAQSLIIGYTIWSVLSMTAPTTISADIPLSFYNATETKKIDAPETIQISLRGKRADLHALDIKKLALHINARSLASGPNTVTVSSRTLFLPDNINVVHYTPKNLVIMVNTTT